MMSSQTERSMDPLESAEVFSGRRIDELDTPTILCDLDRLERNIREWQDVADLHGVKFRVHIKTHKIPEIALMQIAAGARGIICAKVSEAEPFAAAGIDDICVAYPVFGEQKWKRIVGLARRGIRMTINCDSEAAARGMSQAAISAEVTIHLQMDIDSGMHRGGVPMNDHAAIEHLARTITGLPGVELDGITTHRGIRYEAAPSPEDAGHDEGLLLVEIAEKLRAAGIEVREITGGGTFTGKWVAEVPGVTETRAGTYVFYDLMHVSAGTATWDQLALTALCSVTSLHRGERGRITLDGGSKTFSGDHGVVGDSKAVVRHLAVAAGRKVFVERMTEEHGMARTEEPVELGEKIRFYPFHACTCANLTNEIIAFRSDRVEKAWRVSARGLRQ